MEFQYKSSSNLLNKSNSSQIVEHSGCHVDDHIQGRLLFYCNYSEEVDNGDKLIESVHVSDRLTSNLLQLLPPI